MNSVIPWIAAAAAIALTASPVLFSEAPTREAAQAEWEASTALQDAQRAAQQEARRQKAAQALCSQEVASQSEATWTPDSQLICQPKRGRGVAMPVQIASK